MLAWDTLAGQCAQCQNCPLAQTRTHVVFGDGRQDAQVLFVGEGPGEQEDLQGRPFVGAAGQLLDEMLALVGLHRTENFYIANVVKCRPPRNRDPQAGEMAACMGYLWQQMALLQPKVVVCLGRIAANQLIHDNYKITQEHGQWVERNGVFFTAIYHPAALLRDPSKKPDTFTDLRAVRDKVRQVCTRTQLLSPFTPPAGS